MTTLDHISEPVKHGVDLLSFGALLGTLVNLLPAFTAILVAAWTIMRMVESWQSIKINHRKLRGRDE